MIPVGGVLLAIVILVLALTPPGGSRSSMTPITARGALLHRDTHPEWRQMLMLAATRRADELNRLRELTESPARRAGAPAVAGLPTDRNDTDPDGTTGATPEPALPLDIGERSSTELPVSSQEDQPPAVVTPARLKQNESRRPRVRRVRQARTVPPLAQSSFPFGQPNAEFYVSPDAYQARAGTFNPD